MALRAARKRTLVDGALLAGRVDAHAPPPIQIRVREAVPRGRRAGAERSLQRALPSVGSRAAADRGGAAMMCFRITPLAWYPRSAEDAAALVEQYANYLATLSGPWRFLSFSRTFTYQRQRQGLNRRAAMLAAQGEPEQWRVRWTKHYRRMFDTMEQLESLLTIEHYVLYQPAAPLSADVLASTDQGAIPAARR